MEPGAHDHRAASEPADVPALPAPWRPSSEQGPPLRGCGKPVLLGCGCFSLALVAGMLVLSARAPQLVAWSVGMWRDQVMAGLPDDISAEERSRLEAAFEAFPDAVGSGRLPVDSLFETFGEINTAIASAQRGELTRSAVVRLIETLESAISETAPPAGEAPAGEPGRFAQAIPGDLP